MKKLFSIVICAALMISFTAVGLMAMEKGDKTRGKYTYRKVYEACHKRGAVESAKPVLNPDAKTRSQWERVFDKKDFAEFKCSEEWSKLSDKELSDIFGYLYEYAADSPSPAKCQ